MPETYLRYTRDLLKGLKSFSSPVGERLVAGLILATDAQADIVRGGYLAAMPGHAEQHESATDQTARDRLLVKFGNESLATWKSYVQNVWDTYELFGRAPGVLAAVDRWGVANYPATFAPGTATIVEDFQARSFTVLLPTISGGYGQVYPWHYDTDAIVYDDDALYDLGGSARILGLLRTAVRQAKPARSKGFILFPFSGSRPFVGELLASDPPVGRVTVSGTTASDIDSLVVTITSSGVFGVATFSAVYKISGVAQPPVAAPTFSNVALGGTGLTLHFSNSLGSYVNGETFTAVEGFNFVQTFTVQV